METQRRKPKRYTEAELMQSLKKALVYQECGIKAQPWEKSIEERVVLIASKAMAGQKTEFQKLKALKKAVDWTWI